jgi:hypothetical protein
VSNKELAKGLGDRLSHQGLADALKSLQAKGLIYKDAMSKRNGAHALYKSTTVSAEAVFRNDAAEFLLSKETALTPLALVAPPLTSGIYPSATLASGANSPLSNLRKNEDFGRKLWDAAQCIVSTWLDYRWRNYNVKHLTVVKRYEEALATYLLLFGCQLKRWAPAASNEPRHQGSYSLVDPLDMVENSQGIDWLLNKYHITEEELEKRHKDFPKADDELGTMSAEQLGKLRATLFNGRKRRIYEEYLRALALPKTTVLLDFGLSSASGTKHFIAQTESRESTEEVSDDSPFIVVSDRKSAFQKANEEFGRKESAAEEKSRQNAG